MIDFRYHLVSIVSIFLALAVGIVLGAGPLQGELGDTLTKEVAGLRADKAQLNSQLAAAKTGTEGRDAYLSALAPATLAGRLDARTVTLVTLPGVDSATVDATTRTLGTAGARIVSTVAVSEDWVTTDAGKSAARDAAVQEASKRAGLTLPANSGVVAPRDVLLSTLLARSPKTGSTPVATDAAQAALGVLDDAGLLTLDTTEFERADLAVVVASSVTTGNAQARTAAAERWVDLTLALDDASTGTVMAAEVATEPAGVSVLGTLRNDVTASKSVTGVDDAGDPMGQASIVHGLVQQASGGVGQYGLTSGTDAPFAPISTP